MFDLCLLTRSQTQTQHPFPVPLSPMQGWRVKDHPLFLLAFPPDASQTRHCSRDWESALVLESWRLPKTEERLEVKWLRLGGYSTSTD